MATRYQKDGEKVSETPQPRVEVRGPWRTWCGEGAQEMLTRALKKELEAFLGWGWYERQGAFRGYRNEYAPESTAGSGLGAPGAPGAGCAPWVGAGGVSVGYPAPLPVLLEPSGTERAGPSCRSGCSPRPERSCGPCGWTMPSGVDYFSGFTIRCYERLLNGVEISTFRGGCSQCFCGNGPFATPSWISRLLRECSPTSCQHLY